MDDNKLIRLVYTFFLGLLLAIFVGVGINTFYDAPQAPEYPIELNTYGKEPTTEQVDKQKEFDKKAEEHNKKMQPYNRNVSILTLVAAVVLLAVSLVYEKRMKVIADGVMLGGLFTLVYSIGRGFASENTDYVFVMVTIGLAIVLYLGYHRFIRVQGAPAKSAKK
jgi:predicted histidine transporter YuiF (NhaC family)